MSINSNLLNPRYFFEALEVVDAVKLIVFDSEATEIWVQFLV